MRCKSKDSGSSTLRASEREREKERERERERGEWVSAGRAGGETQSVGAICKTLASWPSVVQVNTRAKSR